jgi:cell pole-organizing protein PopZ
LHSLQQQQLRPPTHTNEQTILRLLFCAFVFGVWSTVTNHFKVRDPTSTAGTMVDKTSRQSRKAAGSSGRLRSIVSRSRSHHQGEQPQAPPPASPYREDNEYVDEYPKNTDLQRRGTSTLRISRLAQLLEAQQDEPHPSTTTSNRTSSLSTRTSSFANCAAIVNDATIADRASSAGPTYTAGRISKAKRTSEFNEGDTTDDSSEGSEDWEELAHQIPLPSVSPAHIHTTSFDHPHPLQLPH